MGSSYKGVSDSIKSSLRAAGHLISLRLLDPKQVEEVSVAASKANDSLRIWDGVTLANGSAGLATLYATLSADPQWESSNHYPPAAINHMASSIQSTQAEPITGPDLFSGSSGLAFALGLCQAIEPRFQRTHQAAVSAAMEQGLAEYRSQRIGGVGPEDYDVISGPAGYLGWLLTLPEGQARKAVQTVAESVSELFAQGPVDSGFPVWRITPELSLQEERLAGAPQGYTDLGIAHGIPGPLAALSLVPSPTKNVRRAISQLTDWILTHRADDEFGVNWPILVPAGTGSQNTRHHSRTAWCYGSPGILTALSLAQRSQPHLKLQNHIKDGWESLALRVTSAEQFSTPTLCHGSSGVAVVLQNAQFQSDSPLINEALTKVCESLLLHIDDSAPFGVREVEPNGQKVDNPTLLNGAAGVALAIHSVLSGRPQPWTRMMMIG